MREVENGLLFILSPKYWGGCHVLDTLVRKPWVTYA